MKSWGNRQNVHQTIANTLVGAKQGTEGANPVPKLPDNVCEWLAQLSLLYGVPVEYLTPDARLLPTESMRFFYLDRNWLDRLIDGALSVGVLSTQEAVFNETFFEEIYEQIDVKQQQIRGKLKGKETPVTETGGTITGVLFRSQVVGGWPGLEVNAYDKSTNKLSILRMDLLSDSTMLILFNGVTDKIEFIEPGEGLQFGIQREGGASDFEVYLRGLGFPKDKPYAAGVQIDAENGKKLKASGKMAATGEPGVLDIADLQKSIQNTMPAGSIPDNVLTASSFAIEMVESAGRQIYESGNPDCGTSNND